MSTFADERIKRENADKAKREYAELLLVDPELHLKACANAPCMGHFRWWRCTDCVLKFNSSALFHNIRVQLFIEMYLHNDK